MEKIYNHHLTLLNRKRPVKDDNVSESMQLYASTLQSEFNPNKVPRLEPSFAESGDDVIPEPSGSKGNTTDHQPGSTTDNQPGSTQTGATMGDYFQEMMRSPDNPFQKYLQQYVKQMVQKELNALTKSLKGKERIIRKNDPKKCAWLKMYPGEDKHETGYDKNLYVPIEVFQDYNVKYEPANKNPDNAMATIKSYSICIRCHDMSSEVDNIFYNCAKRNKMCVICKNCVSNTTKDTFPICATCCSDNNNKNIDRDWNKTLLKRLFEVVRQQFYNLDLSYMAEFRAPNENASGSGNHKKRCDFVIKFTVNHVENGQNVNKNIIILIELDKDQKNNLSEENLKKDITESIKLKVKHLTEKFNPVVLAIWKVNHDGEFKDKFNLTVNDCGIYERMIVLRQYVYFVICNWDKLPRQFVWYFWYDYSKANKMREIWGGDQVTNQLIHVIQHPPHDVEHDWKYCCDPTEGGATYKSKVKEDNKTVVQDDANKNPFTKAIVSKRKPPDELFDKFPFAEHDCVLPLLQTTDL